MPMPSREGAGLAIVVLDEEVGATGTLTSKNQAEQNRLRTLVWLCLLGGKIQGQVQIPQPSPLRERKKKYGA
jgi:hypothetical protein